MEDIYTVKEAGQYLRIGRSTVYSLLRSGDLKSLRFGGARRISANQLQSFLEKTETKN